jgi:hypothetical protein
MNLKSLLSICMAILLILAFLTPGVMAKENLKYYSNDFLSAKLRIQKQSPSLKRSGLKLKN